MGGRGGSYSRSGFLGPHGKQKTVEEALAGANPHYREGREWQQNCQRCIYAYEMQRRGYDVEALPRIFDGTDRLPYMYDKNGWLAVMDGAKAVDFPSRNTIQKMADQMANWGDGARAIVRVQWKGGRSGHVFMAEQLGGYQNMAKTTSGPAKKTGGSKPAKGRVITPPNASKELPKSFYQQDKAKGKKKSEVPDI